MQQFEQCHAARVLCISVETQNAQSPTGNSPGRLAFYGCAVIVVLFRPFSPLYCIQVSQGSS